MPSQKTRNVTFQFGGRGRRRRVCNAVLPDIALKFRHQAPRLLNVDNPWPPLLQTDSPSSTR